MAPFTSPATVLKTAESLVSINQQHAALQTLAETFSSKRLRSTPLTSLEPVVLRFIELAVDLRKGRTAKEGLMQYKNVAQAVDVNSIQLVVSRFLSLADQKVQNAMQQSESQQAELDVDDLEASETPESILLGAVSSKERTDRVLVTPWLKFLWEAYRTSLEVLKNSARLEPIYQQIARQAFQFCLTRQRKVEFRRLCETLRLHLSNVTKYAPPLGSTQPQHANAINLSDPAVLQSHLDTRLVQLRIAVELELWQEAFRSLEDVHHLLLLSSNKDPSLGLHSTNTNQKNRQQRLSMLANYYQKCTRIFLMSGSHHSSTGSGGGGALFHAAAWARYWTAINLLDSPPPSEEMESIAAQVVVSALAVPITSTSSSSSSKNSRLTALLGLTQLPTRKGLLSECQKSRALDLSPAPIKKLHSLLVVSFDPLSLGGSVAKVLEELKETQSSFFAPYIPLLQRAVLSRLVAHLGEVYSTIRLESLYNFLAPLKGESNGALFEASSIEAFIMSSARRGEIGVRVDHRSGSLVFIDEPYTNASSSSAPAAPALGASSSSFSSAVVEEEVEIGGFSSSSSSALHLNEEQIQPPLSQLVRTRLSSIGVALDRCLSYVSSGTEVAEARPDDFDLKGLVETVEKERSSLLLRRALIQRRRELMSELNVRKEAEDSAMRAERSRREREERERREEVERRGREMAAKKKELEQIRKDEFNRQAAPLVEKGVVSQDQINQMDTHDTGELISLQVKQFESEKREMNTRLKLLSKKIDHTERAYRKAALPLLDQDYIEQQETDRISHAHAQERRQNDARAEFDRALEAKKRLARMKNDWKEQAGTILNNRKKIYETKLKEAHARIAKEKDARRKEYQKKLEEERRLIEEEERKQREQEEEEQRLEEERRAEGERRAAEAEAARLAEEKKAAEAEAAQQALREEREKERHAAMEQARLQRQREEEAEARRAARKLEQAQQASRPQASRQPESLWRRSNAGPGSGANTPVPGTPVRSSARLPDRAESPAPAPSPSKFRASGAPPGGGWRAKEEARAAAAANAAATPGSGANTPLRSQSPAPQKKETEDDGFTTVQRSTGTWKRGTGRKWAS